MADTERGVLMDQKAAALGPIKEYKGPAFLKPVDQFFEDWFRMRERGSSWGMEVRAGCVLFMTSAYILFLNPLILSGGAGGVPTGMPATDVALATSIATGSATFLMGIVANYPWVVSTQLGTNNYFVNNLIQPNIICGYHAHLVGVGACAGTPCTCSNTGVNGTRIVDQLGTPDAPGVCYNAGDNLSCIGSKIPFEKALATAFLEGVAFLIICFGGLRTLLLRMIPRTILMAGSCGIGLFIAFVGSKDMGMIVAAPYPTLLQLNTDVPYTVGGWGQPGYKSGVGFDSCTLYFNGPPYGVVCPWLSVGGLMFTGILLVWNINGAFIIGIFFTMFISWMKFPKHIGEGGLVPKQVAAAPKFLVTAGALDFDWSGHYGELIGAFFTFLYLDFIGSCITFVAMGEMHSILNDHGDMPRANFAFIADGFGSLIGGLLGSSALTTYVESAAAVREGGRTGLTAIVCSLFFFASVFLSPLFSQIPSIATGPILVLIGVLIFMQSVYDVNWHELTDAIPALITMLGMPLTHNIAYGVIGGVFAFVVVKFFTYQLFGFQKTWPGRDVYLRWTAEKSLFMRCPGWNCDMAYVRERRLTVRFTEFMDNYRGLDGQLERWFPSMNANSEYMHKTPVVATIPSADDSAHGRTSSSSLPVISKEAIVISKGG